jgi:hypothetical protein
MTQNGTSSELIRVGAKAYQSGRRATGSLGRRSAIKFHIVRMGNLHYWSKADLAKSLRSTLRYERAPIARR